MERNYIQEEIEKYEKAIEQARKINSLETNEGWEFLKSWIEAQSEVILKGLASDKYINDHNAYLAAKGAYDAHQSILNAVRKFTQVGEKAQESLKALKDEHGIK